MNEKLLAEFELKEKAQESVILDAETKLHWALPVEYRAFLLKANGGEGFVGDNYLILWGVEELAQFNQEYQVEEYAPGLILFGSDGGGEGFAFDTRLNPPVIVQIPFIGMELKYAKPIASGFDLFVASLAE